MVILPRALEMRNQLSYKSFHNWREWCIDIGELANHPNIPKHNPKANIDDSFRLMVMSRGMREIIVDNNVCNNDDYTELNLSFFSSLRVFEVGDYSLLFVKEVKLIGLSQLERVVIGKHSFRRGIGYDSTRHFYLRNCERLRELKIGCGSFCDYTVCEIEKVPSLEVIEIGQLNRWSSSFRNASLELKSGIVIDWNNE